MWFAHDQRRNSDAASRERAVPEVPEFAAGPIGGTVSDAAEQGRRRQPVDDTDQDDPLTRRQPRERKDVTRAQRARRDHRERRRRDRQRRRRR